MTPEQAFYTAFGGKPNAVTPHILKYIETENLYIELSCGKFMDGMLYGVTVLKKDGLKHCVDLSDSFSTQAAAEEYINALEEPIQQSQSNAC